MARHRTGGNICAIGCSAGCMAQLQAPAFPPSNRLAHTFTQQIYVQLNCLNWRKLTFWSVNVQLMARHHKSWAYGSPTRTSTHTNTSWRPSHAFGNGSSPCARRSLIIIKNPQNPEMKMKNLSLCVVPWHVALSQWCEVHGAGTRHAETTGLLPQQVVSMPWQKHCKRVSTGEKDVPPPLRRWNSEMIYGNKTSNQSSVSCIKLTFLIHIWNRYYTFSGVRCTTTRYCAVHNGAPYLL